MSINRVKNPRATVPPSSPHTVCTRMRLIYFRFVCKKICKYAFGRSLFTAGPTAQNRQSHFWNDFTILWHSPYSPLWTYCSLVHLLSYCPSQLLTIISALSSYIQSFILLAAHWLTITSFQYCLYIERVIFKGVVSPGFLLNYNHRNSVVLVSCEGYG